MRFIYWLTRKELLRFAADRNGAVMTVLLPVFLASLMSIIFAPKEAADALKVLVADNDGGTKVEALINALDADDSIAVERVSEHEARAKIQAGDASLAIILPKGTNAVLQPSQLFWSKTGTERPVAELLYDPSHEVESDMTAGLFTKVLMEQLTSGMTDPTVMNTMFGELEQSLLAQSALGVGGDVTAWLAFSRAGSSLAEANIAVDAEQSKNGGKSEDGGLQPPLELTKRELTAAGPAQTYNPYSHNFAGMLCMFLLFMAQQLATSLVEERKEGALQRVRSTLASKAQVLLGTGLAATLIACGTAALVWATGMLVFDIQIHGSWLGFVVMNLAVCLFVGSFTLLLAGLGKSEKEIGTFGTFSILAMSFAGGAMIPSFVMPEWILGLARVLPTYWATEGLAAATWRGLPLVDSLLPAGILVAFSVFFAVIGIRRFAWE